MKTYNLDTYGDTIKNFALEVAKGNIPKHSIAQIGGRNPSVGTSFEDVWDVGGKMVYSTTGESWEIISSSTLDTSAGTGARTVLVTFMEEATRTYTTEIFTMNATTPVPFVSTDAYRFRSALVLTWGSTNENQGNITIRKISGSVQKGRISRDVSVVGDENGLNASLSSHYTVPAGHTGYPVFLSTNAPKNEDVTLRAEVSADGVSGFLMVGEMSNYQNSFVENLGIAPAGVPAGTDIKFSARSTNTGVTFSTQLFIILVED